VLLEFFIKGEDWKTPDEMYSLINSTALSKSGDWLLGGGGGGEKKKIILGWGSANPLGPKGTSSREN